MMQTPRRLAVARAVAELIRERGVTEQSLSESIHLTLTELGDRLSGRVAFDVEELAAIAQTLHVAPSAISGDAMSGDGCID
jgi:hypothetical protein